MINTITLCTVLCICLQLPAYQSSDKKTFTNLTSSELQKVFNEYVKQGEWRYVKINGFEKNNKSLFDLTIEKKAGPPFLTRHELTDEELATITKKYGEQGYRMKLDSSWKVNGELRHWVWWERE